MSKSEAMVKNLVGAILTGIMAPFAAHLMDVVLGEANTWTTDRLTILYFSSLAGYIIADKVCRVAKDKTPRHMSEVPLFNIAAQSDLLFMIIWSFPISIVGFYYDNLISTCILLPLICLALIILIQDADKIILNYAMYILWGMVAFLIIWLLDFNNVWSYSFQGFILRYLLMLIFGYLTCGVEYLGRKFLSCLQHK